MSTGCTGDKAVGTSTRYLKIDALRVVLGTVRLVGRMKSDDFVAEDVVTWCNALRYGNGPGVLSSNELIGSPETRLCIPTDQTPLVNLIELQCGLVNHGARPMAIGKIVDHRAVMACWPVCPLERNTPSCLNLNVALAWGGPRVANGIWSAIVAGSDISKVSVIRNGPSCYDRYF